MALATIRKHVPELQKLPMLAMAKKMSFNAVVGLAGGQLGKDAVDPSPVQHVVRLLATWAMAGAGPCPWQCGPLRQWAPR